MISYSGLTGLVGAAYISKIRCTSIIELKNIIEPSFKDIHYSKQDFID